MAGTSGFPQGIDLFFYSCPVCPKLKEGRRSEGELIRDKGRRYGWFNIDKSGVIRMSQDALPELGLKSGMELLAIRSSDIAFTMGAKGPLLEKAYSFRGDIARC